MDLSLSLRSHNIWTGTENHWHWRHNLSTCLRWSLTLRAKVPSLGGIFVNRPCPGQTGDLMQRTIKLIWLSFILVFVVSIAQPARVKMVIIQNFFQSTRTIKEASFLRIPVCVTEGRPGEVNTVCLLPDCNNFQLCQSNARALDVVH